MSKYINIALTNRCNLECRHCDIWQESPKVDINSSFISDILSSLLPGKLDIALTGGEPFMHRRFFDIVDLILQHDRGALKTISTNGTLKNKILIFLDRYASILPKDFSFHISFDGIRAYAIQRNVDYSIVSKTLFAIKKRAPHIKISLKFTITPLNYWDIIPAYEFALKNNFDFKIKLIENVKNYTNKINRQEIEFLPSMKKSILYDLAVIFKGLAKEKKKKDVGFLLKTMEFLCGKQRSFLCRTPRDAIFVMPEGKVFSCLYRESIGDLRKESFAAICNSKYAQTIKDEIQRFGCNQCIAYHGYRV